MGATRQMHCVRLSWAGRVCDGAHLAGEALWCFVVMKRFVEGDGAAKGKSARAIRANRERGKWRRGMDRGRT